MADAYSQNYVPKRPNMCNQQLFCLWILFAFACLRLLITN